MKKTLQYLTVALMGVLSALNYTLFIFPNKFAPAGLNGLCTIIQYVTGIRVSALSLIINIPLAVLVFFLVSRPLALRSSVFVIVFSAALQLFELLPMDRFAYVTGNGTSTVLGPFVAGIINGFSYAVCIRCWAYSGGSDFIAALIHKKRPEYNFLWITFTLNALVAVLSYFVYDFRMEPVILCIIYCYLSSSVGDRVIRNRKSAIKFEVVTDDPEPLSQALIRQLGHSVTELPCKGMYSGQSRSILLCLVNRRQIAEFEAIVRSFPGSFAYMSQVSEVVGNFKLVRRDGRKEFQEEDVLDESGKENYNKK